MTISIEMLNKELLFFFKHNPKANQQFNIYADFFDKTGLYLDNKKFLSVRCQSENVFVQFYDDLEEKHLTDELLHSTYKHLITFYDQLKRHNDVKRAQLKRITPLIASVGMGLIVALAGVLTGGVSALGLGVMGVLGFVGSWSAFHLIDFVDQQIKTQSNSLKVDASVYQFAEPSKTFTQKLFTPFFIFNRILKNLAKFLILDNFISKWTIGSIIAGIANSTNPHYKIQAQTIAQTLGPLIFPAGLSKMSFDESGDVHIGPTLSQQFQALKRFDNIKDINEAKVRTKEFKIQLHADIVLEGLEISPTDFEKQSDDSKQYVIYFNGNSECYQDDYKLGRDDVLAYQQDGAYVKAILFNYPRVIGSIDNRSGGLNAQDLVKSGIAQVERLHSQGVPYHKISLDGVSLGGSIACHVAGYYHQKGIHLNMTYASKTFSSTTNVALSYVNKLPVVGSFLKIILRPVIAFGLWGSDWQLDTAKQLTSLPQDERDYTVVRSKSWVRREYKSVDDLVITHDASLHTSWRLQFERWCHKHGLFGFNDKTYRAQNRSHKMEVFDKPLESDFGTSKPKLCGHIQASFNHRGHGIMLFHRVSTEEDCEKQKVTYPQNGFSQEVTTFMGYESGRKKRLTISSSKENRNQFFWHNRLKEPVEQEVVRTLTTMIP